MKRSTLDWPWTAAAPCGAASSETTNAKALRVVQMTDPHLFADHDRSLLGVNTWASFNAVVEQLKRDEGTPDLILVTGDLSQDDSAESYAHFASVAQGFTCPVVCFAGNHDVPVRMEEPLAVLPHWKVRQIRLPGWQLILLESQVDGHTYGALTQDEIDFLTAAARSEPKLKKLVFLHHPPVAVGCTWLDQHRLRHGEALIKLAAELGITAIISGHVHQDFRTEVEGVSVISSPSTCIQFLPNSAQFGLDLAGPGYRTLTLHADGQWQTAVKRLDPNPFAPRTDSSGY